MKRYFAIIVLGLAAAIAATGVVDIKTIMVLVSKTVEVLDEAQPQVDTEKFRALED